jgi:HCOMODA/2-hydroxy-3-carboxy-muconic semialdehyde decarboxylase
MKSDISQKGRISRWQLLARPALVVLAGSALVASGARSNAASASTPAGQGSPASAGPADPQLVEDLVAANRILYQERINDAFGHVSVRHDKDPNRYLLARSLAPNLVTAADLIEYDLDSNPVNLNGREQYSERYIHGEIYKARPDVRAVVHNHSPDVIPFSVSSVPLKPVFHVASFLGAGIPVFDIREGFGITDMLVSSTERGQGLARSLAKHPAALMRGHGITVVGPSLPYAVGRSIYLAFNARVQLQAIGLGGTITYLDPQEAQAYLDRGESRGYERPWEMWKRQAMEQ